jgi:hypothetical protein
LGIPGVVPQIWGNFADQYSLEWAGDWLAEKAAAQPNWTLAGDWGEIPVKIPVSPQALDGEKSSNSLTTTS